MKALTLHQPWASLIAMGIKTIETRSWSTKYRGPLAIHAGKRKPSPAEAMLLFESGVCSHLQVPLVWSKSDPLVPYGAVVATCELVEVIPTEECDVARSFRPPGGWRLGATRSWAQVSREAFAYGDFSRGRFAWLLGNIKPIDSVVAKGKQGLWEWNR